MIKGPGANLLTVSGGATYRVFVIDPGVTATLSGLTITQGNAYSSPGGGVLNLGELTVSNSVVVDNLSPIGAGIYNAGTLTLADSIVENYWMAQGICNAGTMAIIDSTIEENFALDGGGIDNLASGVMTIADSTVADNRSPTAPRRLQLR